MVQSHFMMGVGHQPNHRLNVLFPEERVVAGLVAIEEVIDIAALRGRCGVWPPSPYQGSVRQKSRMSRFAFPLSAWMLHPWCRQFVL